MARFEAFGRDVFCVMRRLPETGTADAVHNEMRSKTELPGPEVGELSSARQALEGAAVAPGNRNTLALLQNARRRPPEPREPLPPELRFNQDTEFQLDEKLFGRNLRSLRRGRPSVFVRCWMSNAGPMSFSDWERTSPKPKFPLLQLIC